MKNSSKTLLSLIALTGSVFSQTASSLVSIPAPTSGSHQFTQNGKPSDLSLCTYEICFMDESGRLKIEPVAAGSMSAIIHQASQPDQEKYLVFYPVGQERNPNARRVLRNRYLVTLSEDADLDAVKERCGMKSIQRARAGSNIAVCEEESAGRVLAQLTNVLSDPEIVTAEPLFARKRFKRAIPTDPFYSNEGADARPDGIYQWYLNNVGANGGTPGIDINLEAAETVAATARQLGVETMALKADVGDVSEIDQMIAAVVAKFGGLDVIVNNAGVTRAAYIMDLTEQDWDWMHRVNAKGVFFCLQGAARQMIVQGGGGRIINIASIAGRARATRVDRVSNPSATPVIVLPRIIPSSGKANCG